MNRKATFAKRQRETDLKDHARQKEARRTARKDGPRSTTKGPEIAWEQAVHATFDPTDMTNLPPLQNANAAVVEVPEAANDVGPSLVPTDDKP